MTHPTRAFSGSIINRLTGSKILARVGQISVAFPRDIKTKIRGYKRNLFNISYKRERVGIEKRVYRDRISIHSLSVLLFI